MVRIHPDPPERNLARVASQSRREASTWTKAYTRRRATKSGEAKGAVAQLGERLLCKQEVIGSIAFSATSKEAVIRGIGSFSMFTDRARDGRQICESRDRCAVAAV